MKSTIILIVIFIFGATACNSAAIRSENSSADEKSGANNSNTAQPTTTSTNLAPTNTPENKTADAQTKQPKTVREYFMLLPQEYWGLECCADKRGSAYQKALEDYLKDPNFSVVIDEKNGYMEGDGDGSQLGFKLALFKRPDSTYLIGLETFGEGEHNNYFLDYRNGKWSDITAQVAPEHSKNKWYELPRYGTSVQVFERTFPETEAENISEKGKKLYNLVWKDGKFTVQK